ncbi:hypothetical protein [Mycobacteroides chelonae]|uniref:hypothetical protein n=1 Tax=Mycobacteroides chelonae TaxID=1774 RepID=UPI0004AB72E0|nr:hypothetical protein [Mycobacteroides chelonae]MBF9316372.1 hypothetical protein [Mycobacteroides chelonae]OHT67749.1 hypothetical protein BKG66_24255 [Mycobacteroides chelonae]OHT69391.1 hypothetical protein BKG67_22790 [Mycobacteroides chelonae]OHT84309.1 hypothetical protein BKG70_22945 [Mycobacteroides chelonae]
MLAARAKGLRNASRHLAHYLNNTGSDLDVDPDQMMADEPRFKRHIDAIVTNCVQIIAADAPSTGLTTTFQSEGWFDYTFENRDWYLAMGSVEAAASGVLTIHPRDTGSTQTRITLDCQGHVFDRYNWDGSKETEIAGFTWSDKQLGALHTAGLAREFNMSGSSKTKHYEGPLPTGGPLDLPSNPGGGR